MAQKAPEARSHLPMRVVFLLGAVAVLGVAGAIHPSLSVGIAEEPPPPDPKPDSIPELSDLARDLRVRALLEGYGSLMDSVTYLEDDVLFEVGGKFIFFQDGRLLSEAHLGNPDRFDPLFYTYSLQPLTEPPPLTDDPRYSTDLLEALFGRTELQIRAHGQSMTFLDHKIFVNDFCVGALAEVEQDIWNAAQTDPAVQLWLDELEVAYSFIDKEIVGSGSRSHHAWGLAIDLVPASYRGKHVYWRWSRVFHPDSWHRIPISERWSPPQAAIEAFERHGFVWGGKWSHFDTIHFEYRPEILAYNRLMAAEGHGGSE